MIPGISQEDLLEIQRELLFNPMLYCTKVLRFQPTEEQQQPVLEEIGRWCRETLPKPFHEQHTLRIAIRSGHGTGKSRLLAAIIHWWETVRKDGLTLATAPKADQLSDVLWREFTKLNQQALPPFNSHFEILNDVIRHKSAPQTQKALARTARKENPEALQGFHDPNMLIVVDEASGVPEPIFEVGEGALSTPGALVIMTGNPTRIGGTFYEAFHRDLALWTQFHFDCEELNAQKYTFVDPEYPTRMAAKYGRDSNVYRVRVKGDFPAAEPDALIPLWQIEESIGRDLEPMADDPFTYGIDVARFGNDETVILARQGPCVTWAKKWTGLNNMEVAYRSKRAVDKDEMEYGQVFVDAIGVGSGVADRLRDLDWPAMLVHDVQVHERKCLSEEEQREYVCLRDMLWWRVKQAFEDATISIHKDVAQFPGETERVIIDQLASIKYTYQDDKFRVETKKERRRRGFDSPDRAEALMLTFALDTIVGKISQVEMAKTRMKLMPPSYCDS